MIVPLAEVRGSEARGMMRVNEGLGGLAWMDNVELRGSVGVGTVSVD